MTVCLGLVVPGKGAVLACDSRVVAGGASVLTDECTKYVVAGSAVALVSGRDGGLMEVIHQAKNIETLYKYANEYSQGTNLSWELTVYDRVSERLLTLDSDGQIIPLGLVTTAGSGGELALGALSVLPPPTSLDEAEQLARKASEVAIRHNAWCGGRVNVLRVPPGRRGKVLVV